MAEPLALGELALRIALLPPISRGAHLSGPSLHAERLVALWRTDDDVPLADAFRLLDSAAIAGTIMRLAVEIEHGEPRYWTFPELEELLPALRELAWEEIRTGRLVVEAVKGVREGVRRVVAPVRLQRLTPDWELSRLCRGADDVFVDVRVQRPAAEVPAAPPPTKDEIRAAVGQIAEAHRSGEPPPFARFHANLNEILGREVPRQIARGALNYAPELRRSAGRARKKKSPK